MKPGSHVAVSHPCGALAEHGPVDLEKDAKGVLLSVDGEVARVELRGSGDIVFVSLDALRAARGRPRKIRADE